MIRTAKERFIDSKAEFSVCNVQNLSYVNEFDVITAIQVNHYLQIDERKTTLPNSPILFRRKIEEMEIKKISLPADAHRQAYNGAGGIRTHGAKKAQLISNQSRYDYFDTAPYEFMARIRRKNTPDAKRRKSVEIVDAGKP